MKILTINVIGIPNSRSDNLIDANVFQDYDAVVVDPVIDNLYSNINKHKLDRRDNEVVADYGAYLKKINRDRREEVYSLLKNGGVVVCLMNAVHHVYFSLEDSTLSISNYDWLLKPRELNIKSARGQTINYIDSGHPFSEYLNTKPSWSAYVDKDACEEWKVLASAFGTHALSLAKRVGLGHIILLPSYYDYNNDVILERCIIKLMGDKEVTPQPNWAKDILVPGQKELISKITQINEQVDALEKERGTIIDANDKLERWKYLLYAKGKHQLEPVVQEALALIGCKVEPQPDKDSDGVVTFEHGKALLEVGGSKGTIKIDKIGELTKNMGNFISTQETTVKGILVGNPFCEELLNNRPPKGSQKKLFATQLLETAEQQSITVLLSTDLYRAVSRILSDKLSKTEKQSLRERIFNGKGLVKLV
jgi:hypothetical protein